MCKIPKIEPNLDNPTVKSEIPSDHEDTDNVKQHDQIEPQQQQPSSSVMPSVQLFGTEVLYQRYGNIILFRTASVLDLVSKWLAVPLNVHQLIQQGEEKADILKSSLISWGSFRILIKEFLYDLSLAHLLNHYRPYGKSMAGSGETVIATAGHLNLGQTQIRFNIQNGQIYLAVEDVAELMRLRGDDTEPLEDLSSKAEIEGRQVLLGTLEAAISQSKLGAVLRHLGQQVAGAEEKRSSLLTEIEQTVDMINRQNITQQACKHEGGPAKPDSTTPKRTYKECSNTQCGRTYHFILSCCNREHILNLAEHRIPYMYHEGKVFLEKCAAFEAIGKTSIIRCSSYRTVDRLLREHNLDPATEFLQQQIQTGGKPPKRRKRKNGSEPGASRNRRNHVSLAAIIVLVQENFIGGNNQAELLNCLEQFASGEGEACYHLHSGEIIEISDHEDLQQTVKDEDQQTVKDEDTQSSSGVESEDGMLVDSNVPSPASVEGEEAGQFGSTLLPVDTKPPAKRKIKAKTVHIQNMDVPYKIAEKQVFLKKTFVIEILKLKGTSRKKSDQLERFLTDAAFPLEKAFLYEGRLANYISTQAIRSVMSGVKMEASTADFLAEMDKVDSDIDNLTVIKHLQLKSLGSIRFQVQDGTVYFDTLKLMKLGEIHPGLVKNSPSKANTFVKKLLQDRGINITSCFLKQRNCKYAFLNLRSALILLQYAAETEGQERAGRLKKEILLAANARNILTPRTKAEDSGGLKLVQNTLKISNSVPNIKYKIKGGRMFFNRKTIFESVGLEAVIVGNKKGFLPINTIIADLGLDISQVYLSNQQEVFAYISAPAIILLLESVESVMVMLGKRQSFLTHLLLAIEFSVCSMLGSQGSLQVDNHKIPWLARDGRLYLDRDLCFSLSRLPALSEWAGQLMRGNLSRMEDGDEVEMIGEKGLTLDKDFQPRGTDRTAFISLHGLLSLFSQECDSTRSRDAHSVLLRDTLSAVSLQEPRLRAHIRMAHFRLSLVNRVISEYLRSLQETGVALELDTEQEEESGLELDNTDDEDNEGQEQSASPTPAGGLVTNGKDGETEGVAEEGGLMEKIRADLLALAGGAIGGNIGDWELLSLEPTTHLSVRAGYGASRKLSFLQPDVAAILRYDLFIAPDTCQLLINDRKIGSDIIDKIVGKAQTEGTLSLLYQLISLRPCFGCFSPELVETVNQYLDQTDDQSNFFTVDSNFIGTSSLGRTYAGTVRSVDCSYLAQNRVADRCASCTKLDSLVINRSILSGEAGVLLHNSSDSDEKPAKTIKPSHQSVWKLDTTDEKGCSFLCPQVQTFNTSLPHAFIGSAQATTIVDHRVEISDKLDLQIELSGWKVTRGFPQFNKDRQLGGLLDSVAGLRLCVGYPASRLVNQARFVLNHQGRMIPEMRRLFRHLIVDETFTYRSGGDEERGTIRSVVCRAEADTGSDICTACRTLQQPLEFQ